MEIMKKIALNSLVFLIDTNDDIKEQFPSHEIVSIDLVQEMLTGTNERQDLRSLFLKEVEHLVSTKLLLGERVVVDIPDLRRDDRLNFAKIATSKGMNVIYLVDDLTIRKDMMNGDRIAEVIDTKRDSFEIVQMLDNTDLFTQVREKGYDGVTVVPDIHGQMNAFLNVIRWAQRRNNFILSIGDVLDYGKDSLETIEEMYRLVVRGEAEMIVGNHEKKIYRWVTQKETGHITLKLSDGNRMTTDRIDALSFHDREKWVSRFKALYHMSRNHRVAKNFVFTHGAVHTELWKVSDKRVTGALEDLCLYGEVDMKSPKRHDGFPNRTYGWVDRLPDGTVAVVGHDIRSTDNPLIHKSPNGGTAIFLDTGCGKHGHLSTLDIRFVDGSPKVENFNKF